jgi:hypothetical protein
MIPIKQMVFLPVRVEDEKIPEYTLVTVSCDGGTQFNQVQYYTSYFKEDFEMVTHWLKPQELFVFTPEQLNQYTQDVIKQAFEAGRKLTVDSFEEEDFQDYEDCISNLKLDI